MLLILIILLIPAKCTLQVPLAVFLQQVIMSMQVYNRDAFKYRAFRNLDLLNEFLIVCCCYMYFYFTAFVPSPEHRYTLGWVEIFLASLLIAVNLTHIVYSSFNRIFDKLTRPIRKWMKKRSHEA